MHGVKFRGMKYIHGLEYSRRGVCSPLLSNLVEFLCKLFATSLIYDPSRLPLSAHVETCLIRTGKLGYNEQVFQSQIIIYYTNEPGQNAQIRPIRSCSLQPSLIVLANNGKYGTKTQTLFPSLCIKVFLNISNPQKRHSIQFYHRLRHKEE